MARVGILSGFAGNDGRHLFLLEPSEKSFYLKTKNAAIDDPGKERFDRIKNHTLRTDGVDGMLETDEQTFQIEVIFLDIPML